MKIAILTQPLRNNYGGLLQAYALQYYLKTLGHDAITVDFEIDEAKVNFRVSIKYVIKKILLSILGIKRKEYDEEYFNMIGKNTKRFTAENIKTTKPIRSVSELKKLKKYNFKAYLVGSDQVWRPKYSPYIKAYFLSFISKQKNIIRASYAASFGIDNCNEFTRCMLNSCSSLLKKFDAISVREDSAVDLCKRYFGVDAIQVIDPTLLLEKEIYIRLVEKDLTKKLNGNMMVYFLDGSQEKEKIVNEISSELQLEPYKLSRDNNGIYPSVTRWIRGFMDAEFVVTDSFHGVVFSIIFEKQFIAIGNSDRGIARFTSLLKLFKLEDRMILGLDNSMGDIINKKIDFKCVNDILRVKKKQAGLFISKILKES